LYTLLPSFATPILIIVYYTKKLKKPQNILFLEYFDRICEEFTSTVGWVLI